MQILGSSHKIPPSCTLLFFGAGKAFDRLKWKYLWRVLKWFKFWGKFYSYDSNIILKSNSKNVHGRSILRAFPHRKRESWFNFYIEPLAQLIRNCPQVSPITVGSSSLSLSLYADNSYIYMANVQQSLPHVSEKMQPFWYLSGYKVNYSKTALMLINTDKHTTLPLQIQTMKEVTYLVFQICNDSSLIATSNYLSVLKNIEEDTNRWAHLPAPVTARIAVVKMNISPRIKFYDSIADPYWLLVQIRLYTKEIYLEWQSAQLLNG